MKTKLKIIHNINLVLMVKLKANNTCIKGSRKINKKIRTKFININLNRRSKLKNNIKQLQKDH